MMNPFDLRTVLLATHDQPVVLIRFLIALFIPGVGLDLLSRGKRESELASAAYLNISIAAATVIPAVVMSLLAWQFALDGMRLKGRLLFRVIAASIAAVLVIVSWWAHWRSRKSGGEVLARLRIPLELVSTAVIALTAHVGGFLSGLNP
jgi:uncharacterized membrane protein